MCSKFFGKTCHIFLAFLAKSLSLADLSTKNLPDITRTVSTELCGNDL